MNDVLDISPLVAPESDELVGDDLLGGPKTITIVNVDANGAEKKKVRLFYPGGEDRPWRPCKGMARVLMSQWGPDAKKWIGKSIKLFRDPDAMFGGAKVGGVRIAGMSHIPVGFESPVKERRGAIKIYQIEKLESEPQSDKAANAADKIIANIARAPDLEKLESYISGKPTSAIEGWEQDRPELAAKVRDAVNARRKELSTDDNQDDPFDDTPDPKAENLAKHLANIEAIKSAKGIAPVESDWLKDAAAHSDDDVATVEAALKAKRGEFADASQD